MTNGMVSGGSCMTLKRSIIGIVQYRSGYSRILFISSAGLSAMSICLSTAAILCAADFVPGTIITCTVAARYLNHFGKKLAKAAESKVGITQDNSFLDIQDVEEENSGRLRRLWRRIRRVYSNILVRL